MFCKTDWKQQPHRTYIIAPVKNKLIKTFRQKTKLNYGNGEWHLLLSEASRSTRISTPSTNLFPKALIYVYFFKTDGFLYMPDVFIWKAL